MVFSCGLFLGIAGINHLIRKPKNPNEWIPLISNLFVFPIPVMYGADFLMNGH